MIKFNKRFVVGTKVKLIGIDEFCTITRINEHRLLIKIAEYEGSFQRNHVIQFTNLNSI